MQNYNDSAKKGTVPLFSSCPGAWPMQEWCYIILILLEFAKRFMWFRGKTPLRSSWFQISAKYYNITFDMEAHCAWGASNLTPLASWASWYAGSLISASRCTQPGLLNHLKMFKHLFWLNAHGASSSSSSSLGGKSEVCKKPVPFLTWIMRHSIAPIHWFNQACEAMP